LIAMTSVSPNSQDNQTPPNTKQVPSSSSLLLLFVETFAVMGRYFIIVYPVFLYFILCSFLMPHSVPNFSQGAWWVVSLGLIAVLYIFKAGWSAMMYKAVQEWQDLHKRLTSPEGPVAQIQPIPFSLLKEFIPGMGQFGVSFLLGGVLWVL